MREIQRDPPTIRWLKQQDAVEYLNVSRTTVWKIVKQMEADPHFKDGVIRWGRVVRINDKKLMRFLNRREKCG